MVDESIMVWASHVKGMALNLEDIGGTVINEDIVVVLTMGLGKEYDNFVASINVMVMQEFTMDYVATRMLSEEVQHGENLSLYANEVLVASIVRQKHGC